MAKPKLYIFNVHGQGRFPVDMLRYDRCWPSCQDDVTAAFSSRPRMTTTDEVEPERVVLVKLSGIKAPTAGRWKSFGWTVETVRSQTLEG